MATSTDGGDAPSRKVNIAAEWEKLFGVGATMFEALCGLYDLGHKHGAALSDTEQKHPLVEGDLATQRAIADLATVRLQLEKSIDRERELEARLEEAKAQPCVAATSKGDDK